MYKYKNLHKNEKCKKQKLDQIFISKNMYILHVCINILVFELY